MKIQTKFLFINGLAVLLVGGLVIVNDRASAAKLEVTRTLRLVARVTQRHMEADMMHDAMRGDVLSMVLAHQQQDSAGFTAARRELEEHHQMFTANLQQNQQEKLPAEIERQFGIAMESLARYREAALTVERMLAEGQPADLALNDFNRQFSAMEDANGSISDGIDGWADEVERSAKAVAGKTKKVSDLISLIVILFVAGLPIYARLSLFRPLRRVIDTMLSLAQGNLEQAIEGVQRQDEMGEIARSVEVFKQNAKDRVRLEMEQKAAEERLRAERRAAMLDLAASFERKVGDVVESVAAASTELYQSAGHVAQMMKQSAERMMSIAAATGQAASNVQSVASAAEEMSASVMEISQQTQNSSHMVRTAIEKADQTDRTSVALTQAVDRISEITVLIEDIAGQINLLALNATIESARAGEAGKGFAVVANEVKNLAGQTATATTQISGQIQDVQNTSREMVSKLSEARASIRSIDEYSSAVSAAVEEQSAVTNEISVNMTSAANTTTEISTSIRMLQQTTSDVTTATEQVLTASRQLSSQAEMLQREVGNFLTEIREN